MKKLILLLYHFESYGLALYLSSLFTSFSLRAYCPGFPWVLNYRTQDPEEKQARPRLRCKVPPPLPSPPLLLFFESSTGGLAPQSYDP